MKLLASICNKESAKGKRDPGVYLYEVDTESGACRPVPTEHPDLLPAKGMTGLCRHDDGYLGVRQVRPNQLVRLDPVDLRVTDVWSLERSVAGHSMVSHGGALYLVATGLDSLLRIRLPAGGCALQEEVVWQHAAGRADTIHCNGLTVHAGRLHVSGFGPKQGELWSSADEGFVRDVERDEPLVRGIYHPHTALDVDGVMHWCESSRTSVCNADGERLEVPEGYCRGLVVRGDRLCVGISTGRRKSESTGKSIALNTERGKLAGACRLHVYARAGKGLAGCRLLRSIDLSKKGDEIYDLLALD